MKYLNAFVCLVLAFVLVAGDADARERKHRRSHKQKAVQVADNSKSSSNHRAKRGGAFERRFAQGTTQWGVNLGYGYTFDLPSTHPGAPDRTNMDFLYLFPHFKYNLFGPIGDSFYQGALYWVVEAGMAVTTADSTRLLPSGVTQTTGDAGSVQFGFVPIQAQYKFVSPTRRWAPYVIAGAGFSVGNFNDDAIEISTDFEFILDAGAGLEYFLDDNKSVTLGYRLWHLSNSNIERPNIGLNAHLFEVGFSF